MIEPRTISGSGIRDLAAAILAAGTRLVAPVADRNRHFLRWVDSGERIALPEVNTANSIKEFLFPRWETLFGFRRHGHGVEIIGGSPAVAPFVILGARPCDAASVAILDKVFNWDTTDASWKARREAATIVAVGCCKADDYCFCTSVGLSPASTAAADVLLTPAEGDRYIVEAVTPKGESFVSTYSRLFISSPGAKPAIAQVPKRLDVAKASAGLADLFASTLWREASARCLDCGVCTYYCPTCHCFDVQDEADGDSGARMRGWDSCSFAIFTRHTSGHNPRPDKASRRRQRIMHKFSYYPSLFGVISCTGCGRCGRLCPVDLGVEETLRAIGEGAHAK